MILYTIETYLFLVCLCNNIYHFHSGYKIYVYLGISVHIICHYFVFGRKPLYDDVFTRKYKNTLHIIKLNSTNKYLHFGVTLTYLSYKNSCSINTLRPCDQCQIFVAYHDRPSILESSSSMVNECRIVLFLNLSKWVMLIG